MWMLWFETHQAPCSILLLRCSTPCDGRAVTSASVFKHGGRLFAEQIKANLRAIVRAQRRTLLAAFFERRHVALGDKKGLVTFAGQP